MVKNLKIEEIIKQAIDIHVHIGPEIIPRKFTVPDLVKSEQGKIAGMVLKNHFYPTSSFIAEVKRIDNLKLFGGIVLNNSVGGLNPEIIYANQLISDLPFMLWFPTINSENFLKKSKFEIAPEWVKNNKFKARKAEDVIPVKLNKNIIKVLRAIKDCNAVLATGHISWQESVKLIDKAKKMGITKIVITHPVYQKINMPIEIQKNLAKKGCFIEQSYSMYSIDKIPISQIARQLQEIGSQSIILSSDVGQTFSPSPSEALKEFAILLEKEGVTRNELYEMLVKNPRKLLGID